MTDYKKTSARFLIDYISTLPQDDPDNAAKAALAGDVYIKAWSWAALNKLFFFLAMFGSLAVILWPAFVVIFTKFFTLQEAAILQTCLTAITAFFVYFYRYYKTRQMFSENILRHIAFGKDPVADLIPKVIEGMGRLDQGFTFSVPRKDDKHDATGTPAPGKSPNKPSDKSKTPSKPKKAS
ncbi:hypothetical protein [Paremcibacter congregatus]|uniref:hypothetical protein n=1 Tax=Paremcibacter congregatus TaxID=2043170 RepID=UPI0030EDCC59